MNIDDVEIKRSIDEPNSWRTKYIIRLHKLYENLTQKENILNKRAEMVSKRRHETKFYARNLCRRKNNVTRRQSTSHSINTTEQSHVTTIEADHTRL